MIFLSLAFFSLIAFWLLRRLRKWRRLICSAFFGTVSTQLLGLVLHGELDPLMPIALFSGFFLSMGFLWVMALIFGGSSSGENGT